MSGQNSMLQAFPMNAQRVTPEPLPVLPSQQLNVPTQVPFVAPRNVIPDNLGDMRQFSKLNQLANSMGVLGVGAENAMQAAEIEALKKKQIEQNHHYSEGLMAAQETASKTADLYGDLRQKGIIPPFKDPFAIMGYQAGLASSLSNQYRSELVTARRNNPLGSQADVMSPIKQKYMGLLHGINPDIVNKFFIQPTGVADSDDMKLLEKNQSDDFNNGIKANVGNSISSLVQSEVSLNPKGINDKLKFSNNVNTAIQGVFKLGSATRMPVKELASVVYDTIESEAAGATSLNDKLAILDTLKDTQMPSGNKLLNENSDLRAKYNTTRQKLIDDNEIENNRLLQAKTSEMALNTQEPILKMAQDAKQGVLGPVTKYLSYDPNHPVDNGRITELYNGMNKTIITMPEKQQLKVQKDMVNDIESGKFDGPDGVSRFTDKYPPDSTEVGGANFRFGLSQLSQRQEHLKEAQKPKSWNLGLAKSIVKAHVNYPVNHLMALDMGYFGNQAQANASKDINGRLQGMFDNKLINDVDAWKQANPNASEGQINNYAQQQWDNVYKGQYNNIVKQLETHPKHWNEILDGSYGSQVSVPGVPQAKPNNNPYSYHEPSNNQAPRLAQHDYSKHLSKYSWMMDQNQFNQAAIDYHKRKGPIYQFLIDSLGTNNNSERINAAFEKYSPNAILTTLEGLGYPSFRKSASTRRK